MANQFSTEFGEIIIKDGFLIRGNQKINMQEVYDYYITTNHSRKETLANFGLTPRMWEKIRDHLKIKKSSKLCHEVNKRTCFERYGDPTYNNQNKLKETNLKKYGCENVFQAEQIKTKSNETKLDRYGNEHFVNPDKAKQTSLDRYGVISPMQLDEVQAKARQTCVEHFGVEFPMQSKEVQSKYNFDELKEKAFATKKAHGTTNTSGIQEWFVSELKNIYGESDVETEYKETRYPFHCDAYIKSLDQFIELNIYFTHGGHPYDPNSEADAELLNKWIVKSLESQFFSNAIKVWTKTDPLKRQYAKINNLNYLMFYTEQEAVNFINKLKGVAEC